MTTATGAITVYSLLRKAFAPCLTAVAISTIRGVPGSWRLIEKMRITE